MSNITIEVIDVEQSEVPTKSGKGTYGQLVVTHKTQEGKVEAKKIFDFATPKDVFQRLASAKKGEVFTIEREKDKREGKYWEWVGLATQTEMPKATFVATPSKPNYESAEERAARQVYIIKQSSLATAVELLKGHTKDPSVIIAVAQNFVDYVVGNRIEDLPDDVPE